jgi:hypothetical protein
MFVEGLPMVIYVDFKPINNDTNCVVYLYCDEDKGKFKKR